MCSLSHLAPVDSMSVIYPRLTRYHCCWTWEIQFSVIKPDKQKKNWVDVTEILHEDAEGAKRCIQYLCERKGWKLVEMHHVRPTGIAFAFDRDATNETFLNKEEKQCLFTKPATLGQPYVEQTKAEAKASAKAQKERRLIEARFPLLATEL